MRWESREVDQVTFEGPAEELGDWSPNGEWLVFYNMEPEDERGLWLRNPTGVNLLRLTKDNDTHPVWSPDGKYIAFVRHQDDAQVIYLGQPVKGGTWEDGVDETRLTHGGFDDHSPAWHPNGKGLAFVSTRDGNPEIYTMQADGAEQRRLTSNKAEDVVAGVVAQRQAAGLCYPSLRFRGYPGDERGRFGPAATDQERRRRYHARLVAAVMGPAGKGVPGIEWQGYAREVGSCTGLPPSHLYDRCVCRA